MGSTRWAMPKLPRSKQWPPIPPVTAEHIDSHPDEQYEIHFAGQRRPDGAPLYIRGHRNQARQICQMAEQGMGPRHQVRIEGQHDV